MVCIRSGNTGIAEAVMAKAIQSAKEGRKILLLLEYGNLEKTARIKIGKDSIPTEMRDYVRVQHVTFYPSQQLLWAGSSGWGGEWRQDSSGAFQSGEAEGQATKQRSFEGRPTGFNEFRVDAWLYSPAGEPLKTVPISGFRELVKIVSNTTSSLTVSGQRPICQLNRDFLMVPESKPSSGTGPSQKTTWVDLRHEVLPPDSTFDTMAPATQLGWQPYGTIERTSFTTRPDAVAGTPAAALQTIRYKSEEEEGREDEWFMENENEEETDRDDGVHSYRGDILWSNSFL